MTRSEDYGTVRDGRDVKAGRDLAVEAKGEREGRQMLWPSTSCEVVICSHTLVTLSAIGKSASKGIAVISIKEQCCSQQPRLSGRFGTCLPILWTIR